MLVPLDHAHAHILEELQHRQPALRQAPHDGRLTRAGVDRAQRMIAAFGAGHDRIGALRPASSRWSRNAAVTNGMSQASRISVSSRAAASAASRPPSGPLSGDAIGHDDERRAGGVACTAADRAGCRRSAAAVRSSWRSRIVRPPTTSALLSRPPNRLARPPARIAALAIVRRSYRRPEHARSRHRPRARRQPASGHRGHPADAPRLLRELAERRRPAGRHDRPGAALRVLSFLRQEGEAYDESRRAPASTRRSGRSQSMSPFQRSAIKAAPAWLRARLAPAARAANRERQLPGKPRRVSGAERDGADRCAGSIFCSVREPVEHPLCGFYAAVFTRLLALFNLDGSGRGRRVPGDGRAELCADDSAVGEHGCPPSGRPA